MKRIAASLIFLAAMSSAYALEFTGEMYLVGSIGRVGFNKSDMQTNNDRIMTSNPITASGFTSILSNLNSTQDTSRNGYKLQLGYEFNPNFAIEGGYIDLGKTNYSATYTAKTYIAGILAPWPPLQTLTGRTVAKNSNITGWNVAGVGIFPMNDSVSLFAKLGMIDAKVKFSSSGSGYFSTASETDDSKWVSYYGIGATYYPNHDRNFGIRAEYEKFSKIGDSNTTGSADVDLMTVGLTTKF